MSNQINNLTLVEEKTYWGLVSHIALCLCAVLAVVMFTIGPLAPLKGKLVESMMSKPQSVLTSSPTIPSANSIVKLTKQDVTTLNKVLDFEAVTSYIFSAVDFKKNTYRNTISRSKTEPDNLLTSSESFTLFGDSPEMNSRVVKMLEGGIDCSPLSKMPDLLGYLQMGDPSLWTCGVAIPPHRKGSESWFGGFWTVILTSPPSDDLKSSMTRLAALDEYSEEVNTP